MWDLICVYGILCLRGSRTSTASDYNDKYTKLDAESRTEITSWVVPLKLHKVSTTIEDVMFGLDLKTSP